MAKRPVTDATPSDAAGDAPDPADLSGQIARWFAAQLPDDWFDELHAQCDKDEIVITGTIAGPADQDDPAVESLAELECAAAFREATRDGRVHVALRAEALFERKVSWVVRCGSTEKPFTTLALPVMTRLGFGERDVLDTLVAGGVAKSRSEAVNWCVQLVGRDQADWLQQLRAAVGGIDAVRSQGPV